MDIFTINVAERLSDIPQARIREMVKAEIIQPINIKGKSINYFDVQLVN